MEVGPVGRVIGTEDATPLEFWVGVDPQRFLQLDDVVALERHLPGGEVVHIYGMVAQVRARHEGARFDSDVFLIEQGLLPAEVTEAAQMTATRFEPEMFVPPLPGQPVRVAKGGRTRPGALLRSDGKEAPGRALAAAASRCSSTSSSSTASAAPTSTSPGISGVATKTSYATFLLHSLFTSGVLGKQDRQHQGADLQRQGRRSPLPRSCQRRPRRRAASALSTARAARRGVSLDDVYAPPRPGGAAVPDVASRTTGVTAFFWTLEEFCHEDLLPFLFADAEDDRAQYTMVIYNVMVQLRRAAAIGDGGVRMEGKEVRTFRDLVDLITQKVQSEDDAPVWAGPAIGRGTVNAFVRRLQGAVRHVERLIRGDQPDPEKNRIKLDRQVTVVDLHNLHDRAKRFAVGVTVRRAFDDKERSGQSAELLFLVLDELNKYAPREGDSPIKRGAARRGRTGSQPRGDPGRGPADGERGGAPHHRQLLDPGGRPARRRRGGPRGVRVSAGDAAPASHHPQTRERCCWPSPSCRCRWFSSSPSPPGRPGPRKRVRLPGGEMAIPSTA